MYDREVDGHRAPVGPRGCKPCGQNPVLALGSIPKDRLQNWDMRQNRAFGESRASRQTPY